MTAHNAEGEGVTPLSDASLTYEQHIANTAGRAERHYEQVVNDFAHHLAARAEALWESTGDARHNAMPSGADMTDFTEELDRLIFAEKREIADRLAEVKQRTHHPPHGGATCL